MDYATADNQSARTGGGGNARNTPVRRPSVNEISQLILRESAAGICILRGHDSSDGDHFCESKARFHRASRALRGH
jgi:hypothetical protein